jgi:hypothetical protein
VKHQGDGAMKMKEDAVFETVAYEETAYSVASRRGFPYVDTNGGKNKNGVWFIRFCRTVELKSPALYVGLSLSNKLWIIIKEEVQ